MKKNIALLVGGISEEREISLKTGEQIKENLDINKYNVSVYDTKNDLSILVFDILEKKIDKVLPALHGAYGEDGKIQGFLDTLNMPYVFSGCFSSALAMNKFASKIMAESLGILTPKGCLVRDFDTDISDLQYPIVVKPVGAGSSVHVYKVENKDDYKDALEKIFVDYSECLVEEYIEGREVTISLLEVDGKVKTLPITEIKPVQSNFYDYEAKYAIGGSEHICPASIDSSIVSKIQEQAKIIFKMFECRDLIRIDYIISSDNRPYFLEVNTIPGMTNTSLSPEAAKVAGISFPQLLDILIA
jgi:D-alanine-D-alanine ligase